MKKFVCLTALCVLLLAAPAFGQFKFFVDYFSNNTGVPGDPDQTIRLTNIGITGTPLSPNEGTICANIYVFDNNQEMVECCSCPITANGLLELSVARDLTANPLTSVVPVAGVVKIFPNFQTPCSPTSFALITPVGDRAFSAFATHLQTTPTASFVTETIIPPSSLQLQTEAGFLVQACSFVQYLGSGKGTCTCPSAP